MTLGWVCFLSLVWASRQLYVRVRDSDPDAADLGADAESAPGILDFGGISDVIAQEVTVEQLGAASGERQGDHAWPAGSWKAPLGPDDNYPGRGRWPVPDTRQCTDADMQVLHHWALKQAKHHLPKDGYNGTFKSGSCHTNAFWGDGYGLAVDRWATCYQQFYNVSTPCAQCIGSVYNMAIYNWSQPCYQLCYGRPNRKDGSHWCWQDCHKCMFYIGRRLSTCYGEPYDMVCRYGKELAEEGYFAENGINPKR